MKLLTLVLLALLSVPHIGYSVGTPKDICILGTTVPAADYTLAAALVIDGLDDKRNFQIANYTDVEICFCYNRNDAASCTTDWCLPTLSTMSRDDIKFGDFVRVIQGAGGAPTSGRVCSGGW